MSFPVLETRANGQPDAANLYSSAVTVMAIWAPFGRHTRECAGVLVPPNLVVTAAHCLCGPRRGETVRYSGSKCADEAVVRVVDLNYITAKPGGIYPFFGHVRIHPQFEIVLDSAGAVVTSRADLAVIYLQIPVAPNIQPVHLAAEDAKAGEVLSIVNFGYFEDRGVMQFPRCFSREAVGTPAGDDRFVVGTMDLADYKGDTGGPCLRETERGLELVGISQRGLGLTPTFTRIAPYRTWLEEQFRFARERH